jgi:hypothetical protein
MTPEIPMTRSYPLTRGPRVRLRLAHSGDRPAIQALLERAGAASPELAAARLVRADPRLRLVICATGLVGSAETLLGVGEIELDGRPSAARAVTHIDRELTDGLDALLTNALVGRAQALAA